eukprot:s139_g9.t1
MPSGLSDSKLYRTLTLHGERALVKVIERIFPQDKQAQKRARTALRNYLAQQGNFDVRKLASWWDDGAHDEIRGLPKRRVSIAQLWTSRELDCPELAHVMQRLAGMVPAQSASERANGLIKFTGGNPLRNNLSFAVRVDTAVIADKYRKAADHARNKKMRETSRNTHIGLGFVNYVDPDSARRTCEYIFRENKRRRWTMIAYNSNVQSLTYNLAYYVTRFGMKSIHDVYAPMLFKNGVRIESSYEISKVYEELPREILKQAGIFVSAERTGSARRGATVRRAQDLEWKPSVMLPSANLQSCTENCETEQSWHNSSDSTRSPSGCSDDNLPSPYPGQEMQEGVLLRLLQQYGSVTLSV